MTANPPKVNIEKNPILSLEDISQNLTFKFNQDIYSQNSYIHTISSGKPFPIINQIAIIKSINETPEKHDIGNVKFYETVQEFTNTHNDFFLNMIQVGLGMNDKYLPNLITKLTEDNNSLLFKGFQNSSPESYYLGVLSDTYREIDKKNIQEKGIFKYKNDIKGFLYGKKSKSIICPKS